MIENESILKVNLDIPKTLIDAKCRVSNYSGDYRFVDHCILTKTFSSYELLAQDICNDRVVNHMSNADYIILNPLQFNGYHDTIKQILKNSEKWNYFVKNIKYIMEYYFGKYEATPEYMIIDGRVCFKIAKKKANSAYEDRYMRFIRYIVLKKIRVLYMSLLYNITLDETSTLKSQISYLIKEVREKEKDKYNLMLSNEFRQDTILFDKELWSLEDFKNYYTECHKLYTETKNADYEFLLDLLAYFSYSKLKDQLTKAHELILKNIPPIGKTEEEIKQEKEMENQRIQEIIKSYVPKTKSKTRALRVFSRHPSHAPLRDLVINYNVLLRLGGRKDKTKDIDPEGYLIINSKEAVQNSASKKRMKECFAENNIKTAEYVITNNFADLLQFCKKFNEKTKFIAKPILGSRGEGILMFQNAQELLDHFERNSPANYVIEKYYTYSKEYRFHVTKNGCFYTCRKMHKADTPKDQRHIRNDSNCVWIVAENDLYEKPTTFDQITQECVRALNAVGLDYGACDVRVNRDGEFIIIEINSAPSFGERTLIEFEKIFPQLIDLKLQEKIRK